MASIGVQSLDGNEVGSVDLPESVFGIEPSPEAIYYVVKAYLTNQRQGNASTKTRAEVDLTKKKMYRQKGTGRARKGTAGSPILVGGGIAHGPRPHSFQERVPKKVKGLAIRSAFSQKAKDEAVRVLENFDLDVPKTKRMAQVKQNLNVQDQKTLLLTAESSENVIKSCRNIPRLSILPVTQVSTYDVVQADALILTQGALERIQSLWGVS
ncbi:MAG: 50S ribosomal protein L4 [Candidatus Latescibacteria bacterium]|jgi:large subunit ribosomal protein L4|nr:50S ribosomal protein L4 [Candidatus Latescibacterota bacterium]MBT4140509.1 50S ribosomal protein L4 [Candidatus Latescibacterota bacterium]MBT5830423.1 50S ribosomal protein L4 [Candidatus Latescibacterota bacterium]